MDILAFASKRLEHLRNARLSRAQIGAQQLVKFRKLAAYAAERAPYYRDLVKERNIDVATSRPEDFPVLTKAIVIQNFDRIVTDPAIRRQGIDDYFGSNPKPGERYLGKYYAVRSSGTSGEQGIFVFSPKDWSRGSAQALRINPPVLRRRRVAFVGASTGVSASLIASTRRWPIRYLYEARYFATTMAVQQMCESIGEFQPDILMGYPSGISILAERQMAGALHIAPSVIQTSAETLTPTARALIEQAFGCPVHNVYACTEHLIMGIAHPRYDGMYMLEDDLIFETTGDHTLVTNLFNYTQPLIRYRMNDILVLKADDVAVYPFLKVAEVIGRKESAAIFTNRHGIDDFISATAILSFGVKKLRRFQIAMRGKTACTIRAALEPGLDEASRRAVLAEIREHFLRLLHQKEMDNVEVEVEEHNDLAADARTGKYRYVVPD